MHIVIGAEMASVAGSSQASAHSESHSYSYGSLARPGPSSLARRVSHEIYKLSGSGDELMCRKRHGRDQCEDGAGLARGDWQASTSG